MSEFHEGRVAATFQMGARLEDTKETYEKEIVTIEGAKGGLIAGLKGIDEYRLRVQTDGADGKIPIKETDIALKHIVACQDTLQRMLREVEAKRVAALGAVDALKKVVADTKRLWDEEQGKLKQIQEFEASSPKNMKERPVGYMPKEHPIEEYKKETERQGDTVTDVPKVTVKSKKRADKGGPSRAQ